MGAKIKRGGETMRWYISYRLVDRNFLTHKWGATKYISVVTDITPAQWIREHGINYHIQYAEKISPALASELIHGGTGVQAEYFDSEV